MFTTPSSLEYIHAHSSAWITVLPFGLAPLSFLDMGSFKKDSVVAPSHTQQPKPIPLTQLQ